MVGDYIPEYSFHLFIFNSISTYFSSFYKKSMLREHLLLYLMYLLAPFALLLISVSFSFSFSSHFPAFFHRITALTKHRNRSLEANGSFLCLCIPYTFTYTYCNFQLDFVIPFKYCLRSVRAIFDRFSKFPQRSRRFP